MTKPRARRARRALRRQQHHRVTEPSLPPLHFFDLPLEIRRQIYTKALPSCPTSLTGSCRPYQRLDFVYCEKTHCRKALNLLCCSKRIRDEALCMLEGQTVHFWIYTDGSVLSNLPCYFAVDFQNVPRIVLEICPFSQYLYLIELKWDHLLSLIQALRRVPRLKSLQVIFQRNHEFNHLHDGLLPGGNYSSTARNAIVLLAAPLVLFGNVEMAEINIIGEPSVAAWAADRELQDFAKRLEQRLRCRMPPSSTQVRTIERLMREFWEADRQDNVTPQMVMEVPSTAVHALLHDHLLPKRSKGARLAVQRIDTITGISSQCNICGLWLTSRTKLFAHLRLWHPSVDVMRIGGREKVKMDERVKRLEMIGIL